MRFKRFLIPVNYWRAAFVTALVTVAILSLSPGGVAIPAFAHSDKAAHFLAYFVLGLVGCLAFPRRHIIVVMWVVAYGGVIELLQSAVPGREMDAFDFLANTVGAIAGAHLNHALHRHLNRQ